MFFTVKYGIIDANYSIYLKEIIDKVKSGCSPPFRPLISDDACSDEVRDLIKRCWSENPELRPNSKALLSAGKALNK